MSPADSSVLITGTTSGVGRALLEHYVARGSTVIAVNRRRVPELEAHHPSVRFECVDVRCAQDVEKLVQDLVAGRQLPEIFFLNAGINRVDNDESFQVSTYKEVLETNLYGVLHFVGPLTQAPASPTQRHVVAISSMVSYAGNPYGLGYHTSKKALTVCFETWARMYAGTDLAFQRVMLGPVRTGIFTMEDKLPAWMVRLRDRLSASPSDTAQAIARFARSRRGTLIYPPQALPLFLALGLGQRLVPGLFQGRKTLDQKPRRVITGHVPPVG